MGAMVEMAHARMADPFTVRTLCEWPMLIALLAIFGLATFAAAVVPAQPEMEPAPAELWTALRVLVMAALVLAPLQFLAGAASMAGTALSQVLPLAPQIMRQTIFGKIWLATGPLLLMLAAAAWTPGRSRPRAGLIALSSAALLALRAIASHAIDYGGAAIVVYFVHEAAAALWIGAVAGLWFMARRGALRWAACGAIVTRVSRLCGWCVAALVISGAYIAYRGLGLSLDHLLYSAYGRTLIGKVSVFAILLATGGYNRYRLVPRFHTASARDALLWSFRVECFLMAAVVALAVLLANTPPSH